MLLVDRFFPGTGWLEILLLSLYGGFLFYKMSDISKSSYYRKLSWSVFGFVFFLQLILGISGLEKFLMTPGKFHLPVPAMIVAGPVYRGEISFMTILFISTLILAGPAWCSHLCYFGAIDNLAASTGKPIRKKLPYKFFIKNTVLLVVVASALLFRYLGVENYLVTALAAGFGIAGLLIIFTLSVDMHKMVHCTMYCPIGTVIRYLKYINPFRMKINTSCTDCMLCTSHCMYDALNREDIKKRKPGHTCTYCGDCLVSCRHHAIEYRFFGMKPDNARFLWLTITIMVHSVFLGLARL